MFVIGKFSVENFCNRKIFRRKCLVIEKFSMENIVIDKSLNESFNYQIFLTYLNFF